LVRGHDWIPPPPDLPAILSSEILWPISDEESGLWRLS